MQFQPHGESILTAGTSRIAEFKKDGSCVIGMEIKLLIPLILFDAFINVGVYRLHLIYYPRMLLHSCHSYSDTFLALPDFVLRPSSASFVLLTIPFVQS